MLPVGLHRVRGQELLSVQASHLPFRCDTGYHMSGGCLTVGGLALEQRVLEGPARAEQGVQIQLPGAGAPCTLSGGLTGRAAGRDSGGCGGGSGPHFWTYLPGSHPKTGLGHILEKAHAGV